MNDLCEKILLAGNGCIRLIYCKSCDVIELEIGAVSLRLTPENMQQVANIMMKASLRLDRMVGVGGPLSAGFNAQPLH